MAAAAGGGVTTLTRGRQARTPAAFGTTLAVAWIPGEDIDVHDWVLAGKRLGSMTRCSQWWLGDWIRYGASRWGEKYREASRITGYDIQSLRNISWVAGRVEVSRRRDDLTWSHHAEISALDPEEQDKWLDLASREKMSVSDLRVELRAAKREGKASAPSTASETSELITSRIKCPECEHEFDVPLALATDA
jgi:hypothetical protein